MRYRQDDGYACKIRNVLDTCGIRIPGVLDKAASSGQLCKLSGQGYQLRQIFDRSALGDFPCCQLVNRQIGPG